MTQGGNYGKLLRRKFPYDILEEIALFCPNGVSRVDLLFD